MEKKKSTLSRHFGYAGGYKYNRNVGYYEKNYYRKCA